MKIIWALLVAAACAVHAAPAAAQGSNADPFFSVRPFVMISEQQFSAVDTFKAVLGQAEHKFWGGGLSITQEGRFYLDLTASQLKKSGQRVFRTESGEVFRLGIPVRTTIMPFEITGGYRYNHWAHFLPYAGGGIGFYKYKEESDFAEAGENLDTGHAGGIVEGGVEIRFHRWIGAGVDVHYTSIPGILGAGGISKIANEKDLGGVSARFRVIVGR